MFVLFLLAVLQEKDSLQFSTKDPQLALYWLISIYQPVAEAEEFGNDTRTKLARQKYQQQLTKIYGREVKWPMKVRHVLRGTITMDSIPKSDKEAQPYLAVSRIPITPAMEKFIASLQGGETLIVVGKINRVKGLFEVQLDNPSLHRPK